MTLFVVPTVSGSPVAVSTSGIVVCDPLIRLKDRKDRTPSTWDPGSPVVGPSALLRRGREPPIGEVGDVRSPNQGAGNRMKHFK